MDDLRFGAFLRAERRRQRLRQAEVAVRAGVSQPTVSRLERGHGGELTLSTLRRVCAALDVRLELLPRARNVDPDRLLDARHARLVGELIRKLPAAWTATAEFTFNRYGERGSVDILAWHAARRSLLLVEVKSELVDLQATLHSMHVKARVVPESVARERGWHARAVGLVLLLPDDSVARRAVAVHGAVFEATLPARTVAVRRWIREPDGSLRGLAFLSDMRGRNAIRNPGGRGRVRAGKSSPIHAQPQRVGPP